jgi:hypothetical protein
MYLARKGIMSPNSSSRLISSERGTHKRSTSNEYFYTFLPPDVAASSRMTRESRDLTSGLDTLSSRSGSRRRIGAPATVLAFLIEQAIQLRSRSSNWDCITRIAIAYFYALIARGLLQYPDNKR